MKKGKQTKADNAPVRVSKEGIKTHHQTGYHKPVRNPTTNYPKDTHKDFCARCLAHHGYTCPLGRAGMKACSL